MTTTTTTTINPSRCVNHQMNYNYSVQHNAGVFKIKLHLYMYATCFGQNIQLSAATYCRLLYHITIAHSFEHLHICWNSGRK
jgi:hypothetical protein